MSAYVVAVVLAAGCSSAEPKPAPVEPKAEPPPAEDTKLAVTGINPSKGSYTGGQIVEVSGNRFQDDGVRAIKVYFGDTAAQVLRIDGDDRLYVTAPGGKVDETVDVTFHFEPGGILTVPNAFTFVAE